MRVALVTDMFLPRRGGIELHVADLAARLAAAGHRVDVLTPMPGPDMPGVRRLPLSLLPGAGVTVTPRLFSALDTALAAGDYDVAHCHATVFSPAAWAGVWTARRRGVPAVLTFHSLLRASARYLGAAHRALGASRWPLAITGVSTVVARQARGAAPGVAVEVLPNGVDVAWWARTPRPAHGRRASARRAAERRGRELHLVCAMRLTRKKRPEALVRVTAALCDALAPDGVRVRLTLAGEGPERPALERLVARLGLADVVRLPGWRTRTELRTLYHGADAFVLPTRDEAFGIAALEARAAGLPVIAWRGSGVADFVHDGAHGHLCTSDGEMTERLVALAGDPGRLAALAARSRGEPPSAYDWDEVVARHVATYEAAGARVETAPAARRAAER